MRTLILLVAIAFVGCKKTQPREYLKKGSQSPISKESLGETLMKQQCYACHNASSPHNSRIAPPMIAIKKHYAEEHSTREEFIQGFVSFTLNPSKDMAIMKGAVKRFNIMPKQTFKKEDIETIAAYVYDEEIETPDWFQKHWQERGKKGKGNQHQGKNQQKNTKILGITYAMRTKQELAKNLIRTIQKEGTVAAIQFCNIKALPITDSMAIAQNVRIRRVSDKPRNPKNRASERETQLIRMFQQKIDGHQEYEPYTEVVSNGNTQFYAPIVTNAMCLQCHGTPEKELTTETFEALKKLYPKDKAIGYTINHVRGLWSIQYSQK